MKRPIYLLLLLCVYAMTYAQYSKKVELNFDPKEYEIEYNSFDEGMIVSYNASTFFESDTNRPRIPYMMVSVAVPIDKEYESHTVSADGKCLFAEDITLANNPIIVPTSYTGTIEEKPASYKKCTYPETAASNEIPSTVGKYRILNFKVSPFEYDAESGMLNFSKKISLNIKLKDIYVDPDKIDFVRDDSYMTLRNMVLNGEDIDVEDIVNDQNIVPRIHTWNDEKMKYLIITTEPLREAFVPLIKWKNKKGVKSAIITVEYIQSHYEGSNTRIKIKKCLRDYYQSDSLKYVLLGGDSNVVPTLKCKVEYATRDTTYVEDSMPTDMYYACFGGAFDWDGNGNGIYGEVDDNVCLFQNISVSRFPANSVSAAEAFVNKVLYYEKTPMQYGWNNEILMCGHNLGGNISGTNRPTSDAEAQGDALYDNFVSYGWAGSRKKFYDTYADFNGCENYDFTAEHLQDKITEGYPFIDVITHGNVTSFSMEAAGAYNVSYGNASVSKQPIIITTDACFTNAFDNYYTCLSESLIRNSNNAVVGYLGCSRQGWSYHGSSTLGSSAKYKDGFYQSLFESSESKSYAYLVRAAKHKQVNLSGTNGTYRWLQFGINPLGDPEMPVYNSTPKTFDCVLLSGNASSFTVQCPEPGSRICVMSSADNGASFYEVLTTPTCSASYMFNPSVPVSICVTKDGYVPFVTDSNDLSSQLGGGRFVSCSPNPTNALLSVSVDLWGNIQSASLSLLNLAGNEICTYPYPYNLNYSGVGLNLRLQPSGTYILLLKVNGVIKDSTRFIKL